MTRLEALDEPSDEFMTKTIPPPKQKRPPKATKTLLRARLWPHGDWAVWRQRTTGINPGKQRRAVALPEGGSEGSLLLGLSTVAISRQNSEPSQTTRCWALNSNMKKLLRSAGAVMERRNGRMNMAFLTATMPSFSKTGTIRFLIEWPLMVAELNDALRHKCQRAGLDHELAWVTELQGKRGHEEGHPCPHVHILMNGRAKGGSWVITKEWFNRTWNDIIARHVREPFDGRASTRIEAIKKTVIGYMTKYVCKQSPYDAKYWEGTEWEQYLPKRWGYVSRNLSRDVKKSIERLMGEGAYHLAQDLPQLADDGQIAIVFNQYGCEAGFVMNKEAFNEAWEYYRILDQTDLFGNPVEYRPG